MVNYRYFYDETLQMRYELIGQNHFATLYKVVCVLLCLALINACAYRDEGEIDYRKASFSDAKEDKNDQNERIELAKLEHKNRSLGGTASISQDDYITIRLMTAFIKNYTEGPWSILNDALFEGQLRSRGEIAILAKVTPLEELKTNFHEDAHDEAHVIFYSNDVVAGQFLNFNNMPIYGPTKKGIRNGLVLELWIMELDISTPIVGALLKKMATSFDPTGGIGNQVLGGLGESLLSSAGANDVNFLYRALFVPREIKSRESPQAFLEEGPHVFIRSEKRAYIRDINWSELWLDANTGRLYKCLDNAQNTAKQIDDTQDTDKCVNIKEYRDNNYLVLNIIKSDHQDGQFNRETYGQLLRELDRVRNEGSGYDTLIGYLTKFNIQPLLNTIYDFKRKKDSLAMCPTEAESCGKQCSTQKIECKKKYIDMCQMDKKDCDQECSPEKAECEKGDRAICGMENDYCSKQCDDQKTECEKGYSTICGMKNDYCSKQCDGQKTECEKNRKESCKIAKSDIINQFEIYWQSHQETLSENLHLRIETSSRLRNAIRTIGELKEDMIPIFDWTDGKMFAKKKNSIRMDVLDKLMCQETGESN